MNSHIAPDYNKCILLTIDMQNDFVMPGSIAEVTGSHEIVPRLKKVLETCRERNIPIIHVIRLYKEDASNVDLCRKALIASGAKIVLPDTKGAELVKELLPESSSFTMDYDTLLKGEVQEIANNEWILYKSRWGAFYNTILEDFLKERQIDTIVFTGCNFPNCPRTSIYEASERDFKIAMLSDLVSGVYEKGMTELKNIGVEIISSENFITKIATQ
ncbi:cysteine hydrolase family protein [Pseudopedobacter beijingensis]|uniref:Cysteine hydrolase family protein n=1 Tax=Pseudopedobacter beijingensis TaxID=1207056 RepID=A0ABW4ICZ8_9SPHI